MNSTPSASAPPSSMPPPALSIPLANHSIAWPPSGPGSLQSCGQISQARSNPPPNLPAIRNICGPKLGPHRSLLRQDLKSMDEERKPNRTQQSNRDPKPNPPPRQHGRHPYIHRVPRITEHPLRHQRRSPLNPHWINRRLYSAKRHNPRGRNQHPRQSKHARHRNAHCARRPNLTP